MIRPAWTQEMLAPGEAHCHEVLRETYRRKTAHQVVEVVETRSFGRGLLIDGRIQHMELDEYIYSESIVHPAALAMPNGPRNVLVVGGGPGGAVREALKHKSVERVVQVEIDPSMIEISRRYFPHIEAGFPEDPRYRLVIADVRDYAHDLYMASDLLIYDVSEPFPDSPAEFLFGDEMFAQLASCLSPGGAFVTWAGAVGPGSGSAARRILGLMKRTFAHCELLFCYAQSYGTSWLFAVGSQQPLGLEGASSDVIDAAIDRRLHGALRYYDGTTHRNMVSLPRDVRERLTEPMEVTP